MSVDLLADPYAPELEWPYLRAAILARGGIGPSRDWDCDCRNTWSVDGLQVPLFELDGPMVLDLG